MVSHAMQAGMMHTQQCCWEVRTSFCPQCCVMRDGWRLHVSSLQLAEEALEQ